MVETAVYVGSDTGDADDDDAVYDDDGDDDGDDDDDDEETEKMKNMINI